MAKGHVRGFNMGHEKTLMERNILNILHNRETKVVIQSSCPDGGSQNKNRHLDRRDHFSSSCASIALLAFFKVGGAWLSFKKISLRCALTPNQHHRHHHSHYSHRHHCHVHYHSHVHHHRHHSHVLLWTVKIKLSPHSLMMNTRTSPL